MPVLQEHFLARNAVTKWSCFQRKWRKYSSRSLRADRRANSRDRARSARCRTLQRRAASATTSVAASVVVRGFSSNELKSACPWCGPLAKSPDFLDPVAAGGTIAALEHMTGRKLELLAGKPSNLITQVALQKLNLPANRVMMVGDRLETDIFMGQQAGMFTAVTLTGASKREDVDNMASPPDYVVENLGELPAIMANLV